MGTDRRLALLAVVVAVAAVGCDKVNRCRSNTVLVTVSLDAAAAQADSLQVDVTVDGNVNTSHITHASGSTGGTIEVRFPSGYPSGKTIGVDVTALRGGSGVGTGSTSLVASSGCATASLSIGGGTVVEDLAGSGTIQDLTGGLPPADLTTVVRDLAMCATSTEDCFNGVDDNCDGLVDCEDPQCTGGATPQAECVPDPGSVSITVGTLSTAMCPSTYPTATPLYAGLVAGSCASGTCTCNGFNGQPTCQASMSQQGGTMLSCSQIGTAIFSNKTNVDGCLAFAALSPSTYYTIDGPKFVATCNPPSGGAALKVAPTWTTNDNFCAGNRVGRGCLAGKMCVPKAASYCVVAQGDQTACNVPGYGVMNTTHFFSGYDDSARTCSCNCAMSGTCGNAIGMNNGGCASVFGVTGNSCQKALTYDHALIGTPSNTACTPAGAGNGAATSTNGFERTVCCTN